LSKPSADNDQFFAYIEAHRFVKRQESDAVLFHRALPVGFVITASTTSTMPAASGSYASNKLAVFNRSRDTLTDAKASGRQEIDGAENYDRVFPGRHLSHRADVRDHRRRQRRIDVRYASNNPSPARMTIAPH